MCSGEEGIPVFSNEVDFSDLIIEEEIGHGSFGVVFKASYFGTPVAVKQIPQAQTEEEKTFLKREVAILQGVRHPNCVQFIGIATDIKGMLHLITDYISGGNLRKNLKNQSKFLSWNWRASISTDIAGAMAYLHSKNIIFRDLKSKNILIEGSKAKICDFGLARAKSSTTRPMTICGTDDWMAPEVILGMDYDARADVFSFGIVLLEIITRTKVSLTLQRTPMDAFGLNEEEAHKLIPKDAPPEFTEFAFKCCAYEPEKRPTFKQLAVDLGKLAKSLPVEEAPKVAAAAAPKAAAPKASTPAPAAKPANSPSPKPSAPPTSSVAKATTSLTKSSSTAATPPAKSTPPKATASPAPAPAPKGSGLKSSGRAGGVGGVVWPPPK